MAHNEYTPVSYTHLDVYKRQINDYVGLWGYYDIELWLRVHEDSTFEFVNSEDETIYTGTAEADKYGMDLYFEDVYKRQA